MSYQLQKYTNGSLTQAQVSSLYAQGLRYCPSCERVLSLNSFHKQAAYCKECRAKHGKKYYESIRDRRKQMVDKHKREATAMFGGRCGRCGYNEFDSALEFHHVDPKGKERTIATLISSRLFSPTLPEVQAELDKCTLLCRNCHAGLHAGDWKAKFVRRPDGVGWELAT